MPHFSVPLQVKALCSLLVTFAVASSVVWKCALPEEAALARPQAVAALRLPVLDPPVRVRGTDSIKTVVVRTGPNLQTDGDGEGLVKRLSEEGIQRVWVQFKQDESDEVDGGLVFYPSQIAPVAPGFEGGRLLRFVAGLNRAGIQVAAWLPAFHDPAAWSAHPGWRARRIDDDETTVEQQGWLCPRSEEAVAYEASLLAEVARLCKGGIDGVYTDFIRYDDDFSCGCDRCLHELAVRRGLEAVLPSQVREAANIRSPLWRVWSDLRGDSIHDALDVMRDAIAEVSPGMWFGASVLPFSALDYDLNTQAGQDLSKMCKAGIDEIVLMGYWDDWGESPGWLNKCIEHARALAGDDARISCLVDADMGVRRTMKSLSALRPASANLAWFNYGAWTPEVLERLHQAVQQERLFSGVPRSGYTAVCLRIDTEPDAAHRYDTVDPGMIDQLVALFEEEGVSGTFVTCGTIAERQPEALLHAQAAGHEIAGHAYDHEQIDSLDDEEQVRAVDRMVGAFDRIRIKLAGFGAPRNSITPLARDRLIEHGLLYDGSAAYDPLTEYCDPQIVTHSGDVSKGIVVLPFVIPNDYDARYVRGLTAGQMLDAWMARLDRVASEGEPCFVLDLHQWIACQPDNLNAVRGFIRAVKSRSDCRFLTLRTAAQHVVQEIQHAEGRLAASP